MTGNGSPRADGVLGGVARRSAVTWRAGRLPSVVDTLPILLVLVAEGAWIAVLYALLEAARGDLPLPPSLAVVFTMAAAGAAGTLAASAWPRRVGRLWPVVAIGCVALAAVLGWVAGERAVAALGSATPLAALTQHPGGWLLGLAFFRGMGLASSRDDPDDRSLIFVGLPVIAVAYALGGVIAEPGRGPFQSAALPATIVFAGAGLVGLALARVRRRDPVSSLDWRRNPAWMAALLGVAAVILLVALPASYVVGPILVLVIALLPVPLLIVGFLSGFSLRGVRILLLTFGAAIIVVVVLRLLGSDAAPLAGIEVGGLSRPTEPDQPWVMLALGVLLIAAGAVLVAAVIAVWMSRQRPPRDDVVAEERVIDRGVEAGARRWSRSVPLPRRQRHGPPHDAPAAYLAAVAALEQVEWLRRMPAETPAEHARRIRLVIAGRDPETAARLVMIAPALGRLAADYELVRFGTRPLSPREDRRGVARFETIRDAFRRRL